MDSQAALSLELAVLSLGNLRALLLPFSEALQLAEVAERLLGAPAKALAAWRPAAFSDMISEADV